MKNHQNNTSTQPALLRAAGGVDTLETNSLCCAAAGIVASSSATAEALIPHEKLRGAALADATLNAQTRPPAQPVVGYIRPLDKEKGGTAELWEGTVLLVADRDPELCAEDGHCELYRHLPAQPAPVAEDEREKAIGEISQAINRMPYTRRHLAECLYDAGYRKQVTP